MLQGADAAPLRVVGRYALFGEIAAGGMATVHIGRLIGPAGFSRTVAIKRLHPQYAKDPEFVSMFLDEARVAARIQHPNVVATVDVVAEAGELFLVMEYVEGESLGRLLRGSRIKGGLPPRIAAAIVVNLLSGLHAAHEARSEDGQPLGIVHRDVSPQNVHVGSDGVARVLDFGVAKAVGRAQVTREGQVKGKISYMPPEQIAGAAVDRRLDVYAAAVVLWESLTGDRLFSADNEAAVLSQVLTGEVRRPSTVTPGIPRELDEVVMRGLARNPAHRFPTALDMARALEDAIGVDSPGQVAEYLRERAGESMAKRAVRVKEVESISSSRLPSSADVGPLSEPASSSLRIPTSMDTGSVSRVAGVSMSEPAGPRRPAHPGFAVMAIGAGMLVSAVIIIALFGKKEPPATSAARWSAAAAFPHVNAQSPPAPVSIVTASASAEASGSTPSAIAGKTPVATLTGTLPKAKPDCRQPKVFVNGIWKYRPECMDQ